MPGFIPPSEAIYVVRGFSLVRIMNDSEESYYEGNIPYVVPRERDCHGSYAASQ